MIDLARCRSRGLARCLLLPSAMFVFAPTNAGAANWTINVGGTQLAFSPTTLAVTAGDTVTFVNQGGFHNVAADDGSFRCAQSCSGTGGDPSSSSWSSTVTLATPGTVGYHCEIHGAPGTGMFGTITVAPAPPPPPRSAIDNVPNGGGALCLLLVVALIAGAAVTWRRRARAGR